MAGKLYKNWTIQEKLATMVLATGHVEEPSKSSKHRVFCHAPGTNGQYWLFVGKMGNVRINRRKPTVTDSISCTERYREKLAEYERANGLT